MAAMASLPVKVSGALAGLCVYGREIAHGMWQLGISGVDAAAYLADWGCFREDNM